MNSGPRKEVEHRAVLVPWPASDRQSTEYYELEVDSESLKLEAERFGREIIDLMYVRSLLWAAGAKLERHEMLHRGDLCQTCGVPAMHALRKCVEQSQ